jgi:prepilin-type N-terminal cleavage/methylation domain-containing protein/prepilin-type processing-associated H-X9-DG protein
MRRDRHGFTLVEILVVIAMLVVVMALLLPSILRARAAAYKTQCASNLHQIGVALHLYHETYKGLPAGCSYEGGNSRQPHMSWHTRILPFIERESLWVEAERAFAQDPWFESVPPHAGLGTVIRTYGCPADSRTLVPASFSLPIALTSYLGVEGLNQFTKDGMLFLDSKVRISDVIDGASNTLMVGERPPSGDLRLGWWYAGWGQDKDGSAEMILGAREINVNKQYKTDCGRGPYEFQVASLDDSCAVFHFWSVHSGGAHFLFADGAVRFLSYSVNPLMPALATRNGGEVMDVSKLE